MSASNTTLFQSSNSSASTLRPRNARLISFIEEGSDSNAATSAATSSGSSKTPPLFHSRGSSPSKGVGRTRSLNQGEHSESSKKHARKTSEGTSSALRNDIWSSWSSIASSLLRSDVPAASKGRGKGTSKPPRWMKQDKTYTSSPSSPQWGPSAENMLPTIAGSLEDRQALLHAKKREALLIASAAENRDTSGRFKRRDSDSYTRIDDAEEDALVYIHKIRREDTLAGVMLKYGCQPEAFRKVNRLWPNDNIQTRQHVFLPLEACTVRGKKLVEPDLLGFALEDLNVQNTTANRSLPNPLDGELTTSPTQSEISRTISTAEEHGFKHDSWVTIPSFPDPIEILRMTPRSLGYFPRARRKSNATLTDASTTSTPKTSFDMLRHPPTHAAQASLSLNASPVRRPNVALRQSSTRQRSSSTTATQSSFIDALRGPGGVGTLRGLRTEPSRPGPADDALNRKFAQYLPDIAPPEDIPRIFLSSSRATPRASTDSVRSHRSNSSGLGEVGGVIEGFVRKLAGTKTKAAGARMGDLIELETNSDLGEPIVEDEDMMATPTAERMDASGTRRRESAAATEEELLNERFPVRGRGVRAYGFGVGKDKGD